MTQLKVKEEQTFLLVKPDGVQKGLIGEIIQRIEQRDLKIVALEMFEPTRGQIDTHYPKDSAWVARLGENTVKTYKKYSMNVKEDFDTEDPFEIGKVVRKWILDYMTSAPLVRLVIEGSHAVDMVRKISGPTLPYLADMGTIRGDFSNDSPALANKERRSVMNLVHASETPEEAVHEIKHWFCGRPTYRYKRFGVDV